VKKVLIFIGTLAVLTFAFTGTRARSARPAAAPDTLKVNTTDIGKAFFGYNGRTPVEISVVEGKVVEIKALPNRETPQYFQMVLGSGILERLKGLTVEEALETELDAVSGATYSSDALIGNIRAGLQSLQ